MTPDEMIAAVNRHVREHEPASDDYYFVAREVANRLIGSTGPVFADAVAIDFIGLLLAEIDDLKQTIDMAVEERKRLGKLRAKAATSTSRREMP